MIIYRFVIGSLFALPVVFAQAAAKQSSSKFVIIPAIAAGLIIGLYESITLIKDVQVPQHKWGHAMHSLLWALAATFLSFNVDVALSFLPFLKGIPVVGTAIGVRVIIGLLTAMKVHAISRVTKSSAGISGLSETWFHTLFIGALVAAAPYIMMAVGPSLPSWLRV